MISESVISANFDRFREFDENESSFAPLLSFVDGSYICGDTDGNVYRHSQSDGFGVMSEQVTEWPITSMTTNPTDSSSILIASNNSASLRNFPDVKEEAESIIGRRELPITHMEFHHEGKHALMSSEEPNLVVYSFNSDSIETTIKSDNNGIRTFGQSMTGEYVCAIDMNGAVFLYKLEYKNDPTLGYKKCSRSEVDKKIGGIVGRKSVRSVVSGCKVSWYPSAEKGSYIVAVPGTKGTPQLFIHEAGAEAGEWREDYLVPQEEGELSHRQSDLTMVSFSPSGQHLASADVDGTILIWKFDNVNPDKSTVVKKVKCDASSEHEPLCDIVWGSSDDEIYLMILTKTQFARVEKVVSENEVTTAVDDMGMDMDIDWDAMEQSAVNEKANAQRQEEAMLATQTGDVQSAESALDMYATVDEEEGKTIEKGHVDEDEVENTQPDTTFASWTSSSPLPSSASSSSATTGSNAANSGFSKSVSFSQALASPFKDTDTFAETEGSAKASSPSSSSAARESIEEIKKAKIGSRVMDDEDDEDDEDGKDGWIEDDPDQDDAVAYLEHPAPTPAVTLQKPFQVSSTTPDDKKHRYMVWNSIGNITSREEDIDNKIVIRFSNAAGGNKNETFTDNRGFTMAALCHEGAIFASEPEEEDSTTPAKGSHIYYHAFPGQRQIEGVNDSFNFTLPADEAALSVAAGKGWVAVATSKQLLRVFSSTGAQVEVTFIDGPVVTLVGLSDKLAVIYHMDESSSLIKVELSEIKWRAGCDSVVLAADQTVPLPRKSTLKWAGFDCEPSRNGGSGGALCVMDSEGMVSTMMYVKGSWKWIPVLDTAAHRRSIDHHFWPVMVKGTKFVYVSLNGEKRPAIYPQPIVATKPLRVSLPKQRDGRTIPEAELEKAHLLLWGHARAKTLAHSKELLQTASGKNPDLVEMDEVDKVEDMIEKQQKELDNAVIKMLQDACSKRLIPQALYLCHRIQGDIEIETAIKVANHFGRSEVAEALDLILESRREVVAMAPAGSSYPEDVPNGYDGHDEDQDHGEEEEVEVDDTQMSRSNSLTSKLARNEGFNPARNPFKQRVVSPQEDNKPVVLNPFAVASTGLTPLKRKDVFAGVQEMVASPSPAKKLNRNTSIAQQARTKKLKGQTLL